jgi:hypothetical protein
LIASRLAVNHINSTQTRGNSPSVAKEKTMIQTPNKKVLIFDRLPIIRETLAEKFQAAGYDVVALGSDAKSAIPELAHGDIDLLVSNIDLELERCFTSS